eukprot:5577479-Pyramimonas_sp.AAC.1
MRELGFVKTALHGCARGLRGSNGNFKENPGRLHPHLMTWLRDLSAYVTARMSMLRPEAGN